MLDVVKLFEGVAPLPSDLKQFLVENLKVKGLNRRKRLIQAGQANDTVFFIEHGLLRIVKQDFDKETCIGFLKEGDTIISGASMFRRQLSVTSLYTEEDTSLYFLSYEEIQYACNMFPTFKYFISALLLRYQVMAEDNSLILARTPRERFYEMNIKYPDLIYRARGISVASFLGVSAPSLVNFKNIYR